MGGWSGIILRQTLLLSFMVLETEDLAILNKIGRLHSEKERFYKHFHHQASLQIMMGKFILKL